MENVCHTLVGGALARAGLDRLTPYAMPTSLIAANLPDLDVVSLAWGDLMYLEHHRGVTHGLAGVAVQTLLLPPGVMLAHRAARRWRPEAEPPSFSGLLAVSAAGVASHVLLDYTNSYGVRPWLPFDHSWVYGDLAFVVDPWMWLFLGGALFLGSARRPLATGLWSALFAAFAVAVAFAAVARPVGDLGAGAWLWFAGLLAVFWARWRWTGADRQALAAGALVTTLAYWGVLWAGHALAFSRLSEAARSSPDGARAAAVLPMLMRPDRWRGVLEGPSSYYLADVTVAAPPSEFKAYPRNLDTPAARAALASCPGQVAASFNRFLYAEAQPSPAGVTVLLRDARFSRSGSTRGIGVTAVDLDHSLQPEDDARPCPEF